MIGSGGNHDRLDRDEAVLKSAVAMTSEDESSFGRSWRGCSRSTATSTPPSLRLRDSPGRDLIQVQRLKKRKLVLRDRISFIEDQLTPDIIA